MSSNRYEPFLTLPASTSVVIRRSPSTAQLLGRTNPGIVVIGAMLIVGTADSTLEQVFGFIAVVFGTINIVGGFLVTDRMLEMFKRRPDEDTKWTVTR